MFLFLVVFFLIYGFLHLYAFQRAQAALRLGFPKVLSAFFFMGIMIASPVIVRLLEKSGYEIPARFLSYLGYTWMGFLFFFVSVALVIDLYRLTVYVCCLAKKEIRRLWISPQAAFYISLILALSIAGYGYLEAGNIRLEKVIMKTPKISKKTGSLKIVQISDVHLGLMVGKEKLAKILAVIKKADPDIVVSTGDLVDGQSDGLEGTAEMLRDIMPRYGKFAVTGNHEFYAGISQSLDFLDKAGFTVLRNRAFPVNGMITLVGVDDKTGGYFGQTGAIPEQELLVSLSREKFILLLKHRPQVSDESVGLFDLQLSGHTHNGQIFPFHFLTRLFFPVRAGSLNPTGGSFLYVNRGAGTWGPPMRFLSPPEVTLIELIHGDG